LTNEAVKEPGLERHNVYLDKDAEDGSASKIVAEICERLSKRGRYGRPIRTSAHVKISCPN
jgi:hypothetical protein